MLIWFCVRSAGEMFSSWAIVDADAPGVPVVLPSWFRLPIERSLAMWQRDNDRWGEKLRSRQMKGYRSLTAAQQALFNEFQENPTRKLILDKRRQRQVPSLDLVDANLKRKKELLLIEVHVAEQADGSFHIPHVQRLISIYVYTCWKSDQAEDLRIRSGSGPWYRLQLLRGARPTAAVPAAMDVQPGLCVYRPPNMAKVVTTCWKEVSSWRRQSRLPWTLKDWREAVSVCVAGYLEYTDHMLVYTYPWSRTWRS